MSSPLIVLSNFSLAAEIPLSVSGVKVNSSFLTVTSALKFFALAVVQEGRVVVSL